MKQPQSLKRTSRPQLALLACLLAVSLCSAARGQDAGERQAGGTEPVYRMRFEEAPLDIVLNSYADVVGRTLIKAPGLNAVISLRSQTELTREEYLQAIESVLAMHNITLVPMGDRFLRVVQSAAARQEGLPLGREPPETPFPDTDRLVSQLFHLNYLSAAEVQPVVQGFLHAYGKIQPLEQVNALLVTDTSANLLRVSEILEVIDQPITPRVETRVYELRYAEAEKVAAKLLELIKDAADRPAASGTRAAPAQPAGPPGVIRARQPSAQPQASANEIELAERGIIQGQVRIVTDERTNVLIILSEPPNYTFFDHLIAVLDRPVEPEIIVKVVPLEYANAEEVAGLLNQFIGTAAGGRPGDLPAAGEPTGDARSQLLREYALRRAGERPDDAGPDLPARMGDLSADTKILSDKRTNALLLRGRRSDVAALTDIVSRLDVLLSQVLIEAVILEVGLSDSFSYGINWLQRAMTVYNEQNLGPGGGLAVREPVYSFAGGQKLGESAVFADAGTLSGDAGRAMGLASGGLTYYLTTHGLNLDAVISFAAGSSDANILSTPVIMTTDNTEAKIIVGEQRPVVTASTTTSAGEQRSAYEYKNIGINLTVTPRINPNRFVHMNIMQTVDNVGDFELIDGNRVPIITKREFSAEIAVSNRSTIVLGGLVSSDRRKSRVKVPLLGDIPLLGMLFRSDARNTARRELLVLLTPYVLTGADETAAETARLHGATTRRATDAWERGWSDSPLAHPPGRDRDALGRFGRQSGGAGDETPPKADDALRPPRVILIPPPAGPDTGEQRQEEDETGPDTEEATP